MIKAIETVYNNYKFRSRLEARYAVFFDALGIEYEYEPEGFDLGNGIKYLPDFYIKELVCYVEIKPSIEKITAFDIKRYLLFKNEHDLLLIIGSPGYHSMYLFNPFTPGIDSFEEHVFNKGIESISQKDIGEMFEMWLDINKVEIGYMQTIPVQDFQQYCLVPALADISDAICDSKQARFEFGESG